MILSEDFDFGSWVMILMILNDDLWSLLLIITDSFILLVNWLLWPLFYTDVLYWLFSLCFVWDQYLQSSQSLMIFSDDLQWWSSLMIFTDDLQWWSSIMIFNDDLQWWYSMMILKDNLQWWPSLINFYLHLLIRFTAD